MLLEIDMLEQQCHALLGKNVEGAEAAREELEKHINSSSDA